MKLWSYIPKQSKYYKWIHSDTSEQWRGKNINQSSNGKVRKDHTSVSNSPDSTVMLMSVIIFTRSTSNPGRSADSTVSKLQKSDIRNIRKRKRNSQKVYQLMITFLQTWCHSCTEAVMDLQPQQLLLHGQWLLGCKSPSYQARLMHTITFVWGRHHKCGYGLLCPHQPEELRKNLKWKEAVLCICSFTAIRKKKMLLAYNFTGCHHVKQDMGTHPNWNDIKSIMVHQLRRQS